MCRLADVSQTTRTAANYAFTNTPDIFSRAACTKKGIYTAMKTASARTLCNSCGAQDIDRRNTLYKAYHF